MTKESGWPLLEQIRRAFKQPEKESTGWSYHENQQKDVEYSGEQGENFREECEASYGGFKYKLTIKHISILASADKGIKRDFLLLQVWSDNLSETEGRPAESEYLVDLLADGDPRTSDLKFQDRMIASRYPQLDGSELTLGKKDYGLPPEYGFKIELLDMEINDKRQVERLEYKVTPMTSAKFRKAVDNRL